MLYCIWRLFCPERKGQISTPPEGDIMASHMTHFYMAEKVLLRSGGKTREIMDDYSDCFYSGCQGNDVLFYSFFEFKGFAGVTHTRGTYELFCRMCEFVRESGRGDLRAYLYGFICHYTLDRNIHPYVIYSAAKYMPPFFPPKYRKSLHLMLEAGIDFVLQRDKLEKKHPGCDCDYVLKDSAAVCECVADMYFGAVDPLYGVKMPYEELLALPKRMRSYQKIFENKNSPLYALLMTAGAIMNYPSYIYGFRKPKKKYAKQDWMNLSRRLYPQTTGGSKMTDLTVREIVFQSVEDALKIIALADDFIEKGTPLPKEEFALNFMGGKSLPIAPEGYDKKALRSKENKG